MDLLLYQSNSLVYQSDQIVKILSEEPFAKKHKQKDSNYFVYDFYIIFLFLILFFYCFYFYFCTNDLMIGN